ncbi:unnamed protein product [Lathyrus oleraceus]
MSAEEINKLIKEAEKYHIKDNKFLRMAKAVNALDDYIYKMRNALDMVDVNSKLSSVEIKKMEDAIVVATHLSDNQQVEIEVPEDYLMGLKSRMEHIIAKTV